MVAVSTRATRTMVRSFSRTSGAGNRSGVPTGRGRCSQAGASPPKHTRRTRARHTKRGTMVALYPGAPPSGQYLGQYNKIMRPNKIAVVGPGTVGLPMAALLASAVAPDGSPPPRVVIVQRPSASSGWKVKAINGGRSPLGGREPLLEQLIAESVGRGTLTATHDYDACGDADVILVCVQTNRIGLAPDYATLMGALGDVATAISRNPDRGRPLVIIESAIAPSTMQTLVRPFFASRGLVDGKNILLANSPNRAMCGRLVESITRSDKLVGGLGPEAP